MKLLSYHAGVNTKVLSRFFGVLCWLALAFFLVGTVSPALAAKTYSDNGDGTVTDPTTGLVWMRCSMGQTWDGVNSTCTGTASTYTFDQANALTGTVTFAGQNDWRLPNFRELLTIVDQSVSAPSIDGLAFPNTPSSNFWSFSNYFNIREASAISFRNSVPDQYLRINTFFVRLVRSGVSAGLLNMARPTSDYVDHGDGTVTHTPTGLMWQRCAVGQTWSGTVCTGAASMLKWNTAKLLTSDFAGYTDWHLPDIRELFSLVDFSTYSFNKSVFISTTLNACGDIFWSNSPNAAHYNGAWFINFCGISTMSSYLSDNTYARLVRTSKTVIPLSLNVSKNGAGSVTSALGGISCGAACTGGYVQDTRIILEAKPLENFNVWGGVCASAGSAATCTVTMDINKTVTASFKDTPLVTGLPSTLVFAFQNIASTSASQTVTLTNTGTAAMNITSIAETGDFAVTNNCGAGIGAGGFCTLNVIFKPTDSGTRTGTLTLATDAPGSPHTINLSGNGQGALAKLSATSKTFASQNQGTSSTAQTITLSNTGGAVLNIASIAVTGDFAMTSNCGTTLAPAANCIVSVAFKPTAVGALSGSVVITSDASNSPNTVSLIGTGLAVPVLSTNPTTLSFPETAVNSTSALQTIQLTNTGAAALSLTNITASGDFAVTNNCGSGLGAAGFCNLSVTFSPTAAGNRSGAITITSNAPSSPHTLALSGSTPAPASISLDLLKGWNLLGNGQDQPLAIATVFGDIQNVTTVWKWDVAKAGWQFYAPSMDTVALQSYATSKGYGVLTSINPGEGFWVNAIQPFSVSQPVGIAIIGNDFAVGKPYALKPNWNLVAVGTALTPSDFNKGLSATPPATATVPLNITTLWAWDNPQSKWYFYAPNLESQGGTALFDYTVSKGYLDFTVNGKTLNNGTGFWANKP